MVDVEVGVAMPEPPFGPVVRQPGAGLRMTTVSIRNASRKTHPTRITHPFSRSRIGGWYTYVCPRNRQRGRGIPAVRMRKLRRLRSLNGLDTKEVAILCVVDGESQRQYPVADKHRRINQGLEFPRHTGRSDACGLLRARRGGGTPRTALER